MGLALLWRFDFLASPLLLARWADPHRCAVVHTTQVAVVHPPGAIWSVVPSPGEGGSLRILAAGGGDETVVLATPPGPDRADEEVWVSGDPPREVPLGHAPADGWLQRLTTSRAPGLLGPTQVTWDEPPAVDATIRFELFPLNPFRVVIAVSAKSRSGTPAMARLRVRVERPDGHEHPDEFVVVERGQASKTLPVLPLQSRIQLEIPRTWTARASTRSFLGEQSRTIAAPHVELRRCGVGEHGLLVVDVPDSGDGPVRELEERLGRTGEAWAHALGTEARLPLPLLSALLEAGLTPSDGRALHRLLEHATDPVLRRRGLRPPSDGRNASWCWPAVHDGLLPEVGPDALERSYRGALSR